MTTKIDWAQTEAGSAYHWPADPAPGTIYRVIVSGERPLLPEMGELLSATMSTSAVDPEPVSSLFRYVQVWANSGESIAAAKASQPRLIAECVRVGMIQGPSGVPDYGQVNLAWTCPRGAERVRVYRLSSGDPSGHGADLREVEPGSTNLAGCVDRGGEAGTTYTYRMVVEARDARGAIESSDPVHLDVEWPAVLREVTDLTIHQMQPPTKFEPGIVNLEWTPPSVGTCIIFRVDQPIVAGIVGVEVDKGALPQMGLTDREQCRNPVELPDGPGTAQMLGVVWPPNWPRVHFVPVTVLGNRALPGKPVTDESIVPPGDPRLVDRVTEQVVTFVWPPGATYVRAHVGPIGADATSVCGGTAFCQVSEEDYRRHGGMRFSARFPQDAAIFLTGVRGEVTSAASSVPFAKRLLIHYSVEVRRRYRVGPVDHARIVLWAPHDQVTGSPPFLAVFRDDRLPMHAGDGKVLEAVPDDTPDAVRSLVIKPATLMGGQGSPRWRVLIPGGSARGYVRLFVAPSVGVDRLSKIVVLDPPVAQLRWGS
ncbi:MAG: hypothetical protein V9G19_07265 [Tetrasphaera sp.]